MKVGGLDLAGTTKKPSGYGIVENGMLREWGVLYDDSEIVNKFIKQRVSLVAIDAPLSHAKGYRKVDLRLRRMGFKLLPPGWRGMRTLVNRALKLVGVFSKYNIRVIETHPLSAVKNTGINNIGEIASKYLKKPCTMNFSGLSKDVVDGIICAIVAWAYVVNLAFIVKDMDGEIVLLRRDC